MTATDGEAVKTTGYAGYLPDHLWEAVTRRPPGTRFTQVPRWLMDAGLSRVGMKVWDALCRHMNSKTRQTFQFRRTLAATIGMSLSAVDRGLRELRELGALIVRPRRRKDGGRTFNDYLLLWAPLADVLATCGIQIPPLVKNDEGSSSDSVTGEAPAAEPDPVPAVTVVDPVTCDEPGTPLVKSDEGIRGLIQSYLEVGGSRGAASVTEDTAAPAAADDLPPSHCPKHKDGTPDPCGPCGWYRKTRQAEEQRRARVAEELAAAAALAAEEQRQAARLQAHREQAQACDQCDHDGNLPDGRYCDHRRRTDAGRESATTASRRFFAAKPRRYGQSTRSWRDRRTDLRLPAPAPIPGLTT
ncbi:hypothetical protein [Nocardia carnea]|uniref:hypothetical protein n=1 Tax=Nocardia carnea TaxID=37328 RepID=UPI002456EAE0|nr:hypothetical protein [Nocardia carnea]